MGRAETSAHDDGRRRRARVSRQTREAPIEPALRTLMNDLARALQQGADKATEKTGERYGFALMMFAFNKTASEGGEAGAMNYISNAQRPDMIAALKELLANLEASAAEEATRRN